MERFAQSCQTTLYASGSYVCVAEAVWKRYATGARTMPFYIRQSLRAHIALAAADPEAFREITDQARKTPRPRDKA